MSLSLAISIFLFFSSLLSSSSISAFNITKILTDYPDFRTFNDLLTQTKLASTINSRKTITVLAVDNSAISGISGMPQDQQKNVLSVHVVLDYYDSDKFAKMRMKNNTRTLTTLFQTTGDAIGKQGFLNVSKTENGIVFKSAVLESGGATSKLMGSVTAQPYNISVLQVSSVIVPPNLSSNGANNTNSTAAPSPSNATAPSGSDAETPEASSPPEPDGDYDYLAPDSPVTGAPVPAPTGKTSTSGSATTRFGIGAALIMWSLAMGAL